MPNATDPGIAHRSALPIIAVVALLCILIAVVIGVARAVKPLPADAAGPGHAAAGSGAESGGPGGVESIHAALESANTYIQQGEFDKAGIILDRAVQKFPADQELRLKYAEALGFQKRFADAYAQMEKALEIGPDDARTRFDAGTIASGAGLLEEAEKQYSMAQVRDKQNPRYPLYLGMIQRKRGQGGDERAKASLLMAAQLNPDLAEAWGTLADIELGQGNLSLALQHIEKARKLQPGVLAWRLVQARTLKRQHEPEKAAELLVALDPAQLRQPIVMTLLAECYGLMKKPMQAAIMYSDAAAAKPLDPDLRYQAALWYQRAGDTEAARGHAKAAADMGHKDAAAFLASLDK